MAKKSENPCWPGYEPVPGKARHQQGSCRPKADSKLSPSESNFRAKRSKQLDAWKKEHPGTSKAAAQHLHAPGAKTKSATKKTSTNKTLAKKASAKKASAKKATARKSPAKKAAGKAKTTSKA